MVMPKRRARRSTSTGVSRMLMSAQHVVKHSTLLSQPKQKESASPSCLLPCSAGGSALVMSFLLSGFTLDLLDPREYGPRQRRPIGRAASIPFFARAYCLSSSRMRSSRAVGDQTARGEAQPVAGSTR